MLGDVRFGVRTLLKDPGFTWVAVLALALGIGGNTAMFTMLRGVVLKPLPYTHPDRLTTLYETYPPRNSPGAVSTPNFQDWRAQSRSFEELAAYSAGNLNLQGSGTPERLPSVAA